MRKLKKRWLTKWQTRKECRVALEQAARLWEEEKISLDVSKRYGKFVFHNKGNSLVERGEVFEPEVQYALKTLVALDRIRNRHTVFADIGVNIGLHTVFLKDKYPDLEVIAFDPSPFSWKYFELSVKFNNMKNVRTERIALSDNNGTLEFFNWGEESSADSLKNTLRVKGVEPNIIKVPSVRMDDISDLPAITVVKMDCEGAEYSILKGATETIRKNKPLFLLEFNKINIKAFNVEVNHIFELLKELNYSLYDLEFNLLNSEQMMDLHDKSEENFIILPNDLFTGPLT